MWRMGVPVATPVRAGDLLKALSALAEPERYRPSFEIDVRNLIGAPFVHGTNRGRAALFVTLQAMRQFSSRDEVVIPAFVCPSVGRAVVKAGLKPVLCDVGPGGSGLDAGFLERVATRRTLAVVTAHLYGYPYDIGPTLDISHCVGTMVIEDAAQAFGAKLQSKYVGMFGDAGVFSFGMSKVLWSISAGMIVTARPELDRAIDRVLMSAAKTRRLCEMTDIVKLSVLSILVRCHHLGPLAAVWGGLMRGKDDCNDFDPTGCPPTHAAVARALLPRLAEITTIRKRNASYFFAHLSDLDGVTLPDANLDSEPVFLRFPTVVDNVADKKEILSRLRNKGINASEMYSRPSYEALLRFSSSVRRYPRTEYLVERMINLPTHPYLRQRDLREAVAAFRSVLSSRRTSNARPNPVAVALN